MMQYRKKTETIEAIQFHKIEEDFAALKALVEKAVGWGLDVQVYASGATPTVRLLSSFGEGFQVREGDYVFLRDGRLEVWSKGKFEEKFEQESNPCWPTIVYPNVITYPYHWTYTSDGTSGFTNVG